MFAEFFLVFLAAVFAGFLGALVGIGGGVIIVTTFTLYLHLPIHVAIAASLVSIIATSISGALRYVKQRIADPKVGMFLETAATTGALAGAFIGVLLSAYVLSLIFGCFLFYTAASNMIRDYRKKAGTTKADLSASPSGAVSVEPQKSGRLMEESSYYDVAMKKNVSYKPVRPVLGALVVSFSGLASGLLGIGGGVINVAAMNSIMKMPVKVSIATSQFMIAVIAATGALVYFIAGGVDFYVVAPAALGTVIGSTLGSLLMNKLPVRVIKTVFVILLIYFGYEMIAKGFLMGFGIRFPGIV